jgi:tRNA A-37 threonylcarbamoyl transferase component Bud32
VSLWTRIRGAVGTTPAPAPKTEAPPPAPAPKMRTALDELADLAGAKTDADTERKAIALLERAAADGLEADALDLARRLLAEASLPTFALRVAERLDTRGDDEGASTVLAPLLAAAATSLPLDAWMLAAEIAERRGDHVAALSHYERVVARDFTYPRARERAQRLAEVIRGERMGDAGATLMGPSGGRGRFRVVRELGRGGAGTVFLAEDVPLAREVALKVYQRRGRADRMRMLHEARVPTMLAHPAVIRVLDVEESVMGIAMELAPRGSLRAEMTAGTIAQGRIVRIVRGIATALVHVRGAGWVHRDVKPSNVLLRDDDAIVLTDFGIAAKIGAPGVANEGSAGFMPKEQRKGAAAATSMDVHALGMTMLEMLAPHGESVEALTSLARAATRRDPRARPALERFVSIE